MREFDALAGYPEAAAPRIVSGRGIRNRIIAAAKGEEFYDGARENGYGGLKDDGRWRAVAQHMAQAYGLMAESSVYGLDRTSSVLQIGCDKGFLLAEFQKLGLHVCGIETSPYARAQAKVPVRVAPYTNLPFGLRQFDLVLALGAVYTLNLADALDCLREIERVKRKGGASFVTLAAYGDEEEYWLLRQWSLLGTTILKREEWVEVLNAAGYTGDYAFITARTLNLRWQQGGAQ